MKQKVFESVQGSESKSRSDEMKLFIDNSQVLHEVHHTMKGRHKKETKKWNYSADKLVDHIAIIYKKKGQQQMNYRENERRITIENRRKRILQQRREQIMLEEETRQNRERLIIEDEKRKRLLAKKQEKEAKQKEKEKRIQQMKLASLHYNLILLQRQALTPWRRMVSEARIKFNKVRISLHVYWKTKIEK